MHLVVFALVLLSRLPLCAQDNPYPPGTFQLAPKVDLGLQPVELEIPAQFGDLPPITLNLPPGFSASVFAVTSRPGRARMMAFSPRGVLHLAHATRILALPDRDADGVADEVIEVASGLTWTNSIAFYKGDLYAAETDKIIRYRDADGDLVYEEQEIFIDTLPWAESAWHTSRAIAFDEINEKVYVAIGSPCDLCRSEKPFRAASLERLEPNPEWDAVLEFNTDGTGRRVFATGMRNVVGMDIHPITNELWGDHNGHDQEGAHLPPEWIDVIGDGDFQGYPFVYGYQVPMDFSIERYTDKDLLPLTRQDSLRIQTHQAPVALVEAHQAPLGIHFYRGDLFPPQYQNMAFVSLHGGMVEGNLSVVPGFKVIAVFSAPDGSNAKVADFLTGFGRGPERADVWGKPVGITTDAAGNMFVSSDSNNMVVLKITHSAVSGLWEHSLPEEIPVGSELNAAALVRLLRLAEGGGPPRVTANLETFGGPRALELGAEGDNAFRLDAALEVRGALGPRTISVLIEQDVGDVTHRMSLSRTIEVVSPVAGLWEHSLPAIIPVGSELDAEVLVRLLRLAENGDPPQVTADLQAFGGPAALELRAEGDRAFRLDTALEVRGALGPRTISVLIEQYVFRGPYRTSLSQTIEVVPAIGGVWEHSLPDTVVRGSTLRVEALVRLQWLAENRPPPKVTVDLSPFGGPEELELEALGDQTYRLDTTLELAGRSGAHTLSILAQQDPILVEYQAVFSKTIAVLPGGDELILGDELAGGWQVEARGGALPPLLTADGPVFSGEKASAVQVDPTHFLIDWELDLKPVPPLDPFGFEALRFAVHPGDVRESKRASFVVSVGGFSVDLIRGEEEFRVDLTRPEWQVIEIPLSQFSVVYDNYATKGEEHVVAIEAIRLAGNLEGTFYLDDMRLVSSVTAPPAPTAVEEGADPVPEAFSLGQNFPNPFNSETAIRFALEARGEVELVIYNLSGQRVAVLVDDERAAGRYELRWDSRDDKGRALATGVYLYRLRVGTQVDTRKLLLLR